MQIDSDARPRRPLIACMSSETDCSYYFTIAVDKFLILQHTRSLSGFINTTMRCYHSSEDLSCDKGIREYIRKSSLPKQQSNLTPPPSSYLLLRLTAQDPADNSGVIIAEFGMGVRLQRVTEYRTACEAWLLNDPRILPQQFYCTAFTLTW